jgi:hypothetical protein
LTLSSFKLSTLSACKLERKMPRRKGDNIADSGDKRWKFVSLAESRTKNAIKAIRVIAKLGNKSAYQYDETDVKKIASALTALVSKICSPRRRPCHSTTFRISPNAPKCAI